MPKNKFRWSRDAKQRLLANVEMVTESGCWIFMGKLDRNGYGQITDDHQKRRQAHIVAYEIFIGSVPDGLELDHNCRVRCCCNPWHVEPVTHAENLRRGNVYSIGAAVRGRQTSARTHCAKGHEYPKNPRINRRGWRMCVLCKSHNAKGSYRRKKNGSVGRSPNGAIPLVPFGVSNSLIR